MLQTAIEKPVKLNATLNYMGTFYPDYGIELLIFRHKNLGLNAKFTGSPHNLIGHVALLSPCREE
jgi:hypothetical protein